MRKFWTIVKHTYRKNVQTGAFVGMVFAPLLMIAVIGLIGYFIGGGFDNEDPTIAVISDEQGLVETLEAVDSNININREITKQEDADIALAAEEIDGYLTLEQSENDVIADFVHTGNSLSQTGALIEELLSTIQTQIRGASLGLSAEQVSTLMEPIQYNEQVVSVDDGQIVDQNNENKAIGLAVAQIPSLALFILITYYISIIATEIASEKGTRIMEIVLSSTSATTHFFGKIVGVLLVCLTQLLIYGIIGIGGYYIAQQQGLLPDLVNEVLAMDIVGEILGASVIFFIVGLLLYVVVAAFLGSLATKIEDVNKVVTPVMLLAMIGWYAGIFGYMDGVEKTWTTIMSYIPFFTPLLMPFRIANQSVSTAGLWTSIGITVFFTIILMGISLILYQGSVLVYSDGNFFQTLKQSWQVVRGNQKAKKNS